MNEKLPFSDVFIETELATSAIRNASKAVMEIYNSKFTTSFKDGNEPITEADLKSNQIILNSLSESNHPILSEESKDNLEKRLDAKKVWIVDPLDGTTDFVNKTGEFTIMIALVENQTPILGVISCPPQNTLYVAQKGHGAYSSSNDDKWKKLEVSNTNDLSNCKAVGSRFHQSDKERNFLKKLNITQFTSRGSSLKAIDLCLAKADLYFTFTSKMKQWDTCASNCIVTEAGGKFTDMNGNVLKYNIEKLNHENGLLVTNGIIHNKIIETYKKFS
jgi:3'(2'), 5'-bisphosphate nucleotidase